MRAVIDDTVKKCVSSGKQSKKYFNNLKIVASSEIGSFRHEEMFHGNTTSAYLFVIPPDIPTSCRAVGTDILPIRKLTLNSLILYSFSDVFRFQDFQFQHTPIFGASVVRR